MEDSDESRGGGQHGKAESSRSSRADLGWSTREERLSRDERSQVERVQQDLEGEDSKKLRHTSRSESESSSSEKDIVILSSKPTQTVEERLRAIGGSQGEVQRGQWLQEEMDRYKKQHGIDEDGDPTSEEIRLQLKLPDPKNISRFEEPVKVWLPVDSSGIPSWRKELLPEEEEVRTILEPNSGPV